jgi:hypothetical protein
VKFRATKWLKHLALLSVMVFAVCLSYLHGVVKDEFSQPLDLTNSQCLEGKILSLPFAKNNKFITLFFASLCIIETFVKPQQIKTTI